MLLGRRAVALDTTDRTVTLDDGTLLEFDGVVLATGSIPRRLRDVPDLQHLFTLRTLDDAVALRDAVAGAERVVVVGAGFIGCEVAASCRQLGKHVTVVEFLPAPLPPSLGPVLGTACADLHRTHGVDLRLGVGVDAIQGDGRVERVLLADGEVLEADIVVEGIGVVPDTAWLAGSDLWLDDGVVCDATCTALRPDGTPVEGVVAAGDLARWHNELFDERMRIEHWDNAVDQAGAAARRLLEGPSTPPYAPAPYFWSDQYDVKIQFAGRAVGAERFEIVHGSVEEGRWVGLYGRADRLVGVVAWNWPRHVIRYRRLVVERTSWDDAVSPP